MTNIKQPNLIVFISSACIMILELIAGRIIAPYVGVSLYTWTSVIGVVLAGISLGNYLGGRLADRWASQRLLGGIFLLGGLSCFGVLAADAVGKLTPGDWPIVLEILVLTLVLFFLPCVILGTISPIVAKLAVRDLAATGSTVGKIYAAGALGSIVGTFATGFVLISWFGTFAIAWGVGIALLLMGALFFFRGRRALTPHPLSPSGERACPATGGSVEGGLEGEDGGTGLARPGRTRHAVLLAVVVLLAAASGLALSRGWLRGPCTRETNYFCIKVRQEERDSGPVQVLILDRLVHSYSSLDDPTQLVYGYERMYAEATAYRAQRDDDPSGLRALFIGGGGYTFPRYMEALYPGSDIHVIEIDPDVTQVAYDMLGLKRDSRVVTYNQDARLFMERDPAETYDLVLGDAFNDFSVPYHLTTKEFNQRVRRWLTDDGLYMVNMIDGGRADFLRAYIHTLRQTFRHVYVAPSVTDWRQTARTTFVLIASDAPLDLAALSKLDAGDGEALLGRQMLSQAEVDALLAEGRAVTLTDQYAPVDQMLRPVVRGEIVE